MADNTVRSLAVLPIDVCVALAKGAPSQSKRFVREIMARIRLESATIVNAEISSHAQDAMMVQSRLFNALGQIVYVYWESLTDADKLRFTSHAMTESERKSFLNILMKPISDDESMDEDGGG